MVNPMSIRAWDTVATMWWAPSSLPVMTMPPTFPKATGRPLSSVSSNRASIRSSARIQTLDIWPTQVGVAKTTMLAAMILSWTAGQSSPSP